MERNDVHIGDIVRHILAPKDKLLVIDFDYESGEIVCRDSLLNKKKFFPSEIYIDSTDKQDEEK